MLHPNCILRLHTFLMKNYFAVVTVAPMQTSLSSTVNADVVAGFTQIVLDIWFDPQPLVTVESNIMVTGCSKSVTWG